MKEINSSPESAEKISRYQKTNRIKKAQKEAESSFDRILIDQLDQKDRSLKSGSIESLGEIQGSFRAGKLEQAADRAWLTDRIEFSIDLLDRYAAALGSEDKTLKQAWNILKQLTDMTAFTKNKLAGSNGDIDGDLKNIINQILSIVETENIKFQRGDYSDLSASS